MLKVLFKGKKVIGYADRDLEAQHTRRYILKRSEGTHSSEEDGLSLEDIDVIINTHLHPGHTGNNEIFPKASRCARVA